MSYDPIEECVKNIQSFRNYLDDILESIKTNDYNEETINKVSKMIREYNNNNLFLNSEDEYIQLEYEDEEEEEYEETESEYSDDEISKIFNSDNQSDSQIKEEKQTDIHMEQFKNNNVDYSKIELYDKNKNINLRLNDFLNSFQSF